MSGLRDSYLELYNAGTKANITDYYRMAPTLVVSEATIVTRRFTCNPK